MKRSTLVALGFGIAAFTLYLASLPPSYAFWDTGELQTVSAILGIAHPPACPTFVLLGWTLAHVIPFGEVAWRVNVMCALSVAIVVALSYAMARRFGVSPIVAVLVTIGFASASVVWKDATRAEVQDVALLFRVLAFVFACAYADRGRMRDLFFSALALGLAGATHGTALLLTPALAIVVAPRYRELRVRAVLLAVAGIALGLAPYAYLPFRSAWLLAHHVDPTVAIGLPPGAAPFWDYDHPATLANFWRVVTGADFDVHSGFAGFANVGRYPQYAAALVTRLGGAYGIVGAILAALGAGALVVSRRSDRIALVTIAVLVVPYTEAYTELQDPDRYYTIALWCGAIAIGVALDTIARLLRLEAPSIGRFVVLGSVFASFVSAAPARLELFHQRDDYGARTYVREVVASVPDGAIVLADWAYATPLAYAAYVEGSFGHRIAIAASPAQYAAYFPRWLARGEVYAVAFDDDLHIPGFAVRPILHHSYNIYRIASEDRKR